MVDTTDIKNTVKELMKINHIEKIALKDLILKSLIQKRPSFKRSPHIQNSSADLKNIEPELMG